MLKTSQQGGVYEASQVGDSAEATRQGAKEPPVAICTKQASDPAEVIAQVCERTPNALTPEDLMQR